MNRVRMLLLLGIIGLALVLVAACGGSDEEEDRR